MVEKVYLWERVNWRRDTEHDLWRQDWESVSVITEAFFESKTGAEEIGFFEGLGATVEVVTDEDGWVFFTNTRPDGCEKTCERFIPYEIADTGGIRERTALEESEDLNVIPLVDRTDEHVVVEFGVETKALYDLEEDVWC